MKKLVTHLIPHLDDIAALWLLKRFDSSSKKAGLKFVPTSAKGIKLPKNEIGVGVGRGKYDEHKGDLREAAVSLVWKDLKKRKKLPRGTKGAAIAELVDFVRRGDLGEFIGKSGPTFHLGSILRKVTRLPGHNSRTSTLIGFTLLDSMYRLYEERVLVDRAIAKGLKFKTKWGKGIAITVDALPASVSDRIAELGYAMVVLQYPKTKYLHVRATPGTKVNLHKLGRLLQKEEPQADWYLHHSKKLLIQGDWIAPVKHHTRYTYKTMPKLIRKLYA